MARGDWATYKRLLRFVGPYWPYLVVCFVGFLAAAGGEAYFAKLFGDLIDNWEGASQQLTWYSIPVLMLGAALVRA